MFVFPRLQTTSDFGLDFCLVVHVAGKLAALVLPQGELRVVVHGYTKPAQVDAQAVDVEAVEPGQGHQGLEVRVNLVRRPAEVPSMC